MADDMSSSSAILSRRVGDFLRKEVADWDDVVMATARFKAFSGQRSDWEPRYTFWRDLILKVATHLGIFRLHPSQVYPYYTQLSHSFCSVIYFLVQTFR